MTPADTRATGIGIPDRMLLPVETLEEMNRLWTITKSFSTTAHDVNNALQVISGSAELLATRTDLDPAILRRVEAVRVQAAKAAATIDRLLVYSRAAAGAVQRLDLAVVTETAVAMRACSLGRAHITADISRSDDQPYWIAAESPKLLQLLLNLLLSLEDVLTGRQNPRIDIRLDRQASAVTVSMRGAAQSEVNGSAECSRLSSDAAVGSPLWAASRLAAAQSGILTVDECDGATLMALAMRAALT